MLLIFLYLLNIVGRCYHTNSFVVVACGSKLCLNYAVIKSKIDAICFYFPALPNYVIYISGRMNLQGLRAGAGGQAGLIS